MKYFPGKSIKRREIRIRLILFEAFLKIC
jgi:hypothetical protein